MSIDELDAALAKITEADLRDPLFRMLVDSAKLTKESHALVVRLCADYKRQEEEIARLKQDLKLANEYADQCQYAMKICEEDNARLREMADENERMQKVIAAAKTWREAYTKFWVHESPMEPSHILFAALDAYNAAVRDLKALKGE